MNGKIVTGFVLAFAAIVSMAAISSAQPGPGTYPYTDYDPWLNPWSEPDDWSSPWSSDWPYQVDEPYAAPEPTPGPGTPSETYRSDGAPTSSRPGGSQPSSAPSASTGSPISSFGDGELLSESEVRGLPGGSSLLAPGGAAAPIASGERDALYSYYGGSYAYRSYYGGLQHWIYYCGRWSYGPAAMWYGQQTNTIIRNDQYQRIWSYERYPNGNEEWQYWGYWYPGYHHAWFGAYPYKGWHQIAVWGSRSGWSNPIWVYVW